MKKILLLLLLVLLLCVTMYAQPGGTRIRYVDVTRYTNGVADGTTENTSAVKSARTAAYAQDHNTIYFPPDDDFYILDTLIFDSEIHLIIDEGARIQFFNNTSIARSDSVALFTLKGNNSSMSGGGFIDFNYPADSNWAKGIRILMADSCTIENLDMIDGGIYVEDGSYNRILNNEIKVSADTARGWDYTSEGGPNEPDVYGIFLQNTDSSAAVCHDNLIEGNYVDNTNSSEAAIKDFGLNNTSYNYKNRIIGNTTFNDSIGQYPVGIETRFSQFGSIVGNTTEGAWAAISIAGSDWTTISGNAAKNVGRIGIEIVDSKGSTADGNTIEMSDSGTTGISLDTLNETTAASRGFSSASNNTIFMKDSCNRAIFVEGYQDNIGIRGNDIHITAVEGGTALYYGIMVIEGCENLSIVGNTIDMNDSTTGHAIFIRGSDFANIVGNTLIDVTGTAITLGQGASDSDMKSDSAFVSGNQFVNVTTNTFEDALAVGNVWGINRYMHETLTLVDDVVMDSGLTVNGKDLTVGGDLSIGVGLSNPFWQLVVADSTYPRIQICDSTTGTSGTDGFQLILDDAGAQVNNYENGHIRWATNNTGWMTLTATGGLGLGSGITETNPGRFKTSSHITSGADFFASGNDYCFGTDTDNKVWLDSDTIKFDINGVTQAWVTVDGQVLERVQDTHTLSFPIVDPSASESIALHKFTDDITITKVVAVTRDSSITFNLSHDDSSYAAGTDIFASNQAITDNATGTELTSFANDTIPDNNWLRFRTSAVAGEVNEQLTVIIEYTIDQ